MTLRSKIINKKSVKWGQVLVVDKLYSNERLIKQFVDALKSNKPEITDEEIEMKKKEMIKRDNFYNRAMDEVSKAYEIEFNEEELQEKKQEYSNSNLSSEEIESQVRVNIFKRLIYEDLAKEWEIEVTDEIAKKALESFYKSTGKSIREYLDDPKKLNEIKESILDQLITNRIMNAFESQFNLNEDATPPGSSKPS